MFSTEKDLERAFRQHYPGLIAFANKIIGDLDESEDLVQELFVYCYENRNNLEIKQSTKAYLYQAIFNKCKSHQRKAITKEKYAAEIVQDHQNEYADYLVQVELEERIYSEINRLPPRCREVFKLSRFEAKSNEDIAAALGISKRTVETQISKALKILRQRLSPELFFLLFL